MWELKINGIVSLLFAVCLLSVVPVTTNAQDAPYNESDLDFTRRITARIESIEAQTAQLENVVVRSWNPEKTESESAAADSDEHGRIKVKLDALKEKSNSQRIRLDTHAAASRTENRPARLNREAIEANVSQMERELAALKRDMEVREISR